MILIEFVDSVVKFSSAKLENIGTLNAFEVKGYWKMVLCKIIK